MSATHDQLPERPRPQPAPENQPHWDGMREHRLLVQRCAQCQKLRHYPRPVCDACYAMDYDWAELSGHGTIHTWAVSHHPFHAGFKKDLPYITVTVDLDGGVRMQAPLQTDDASKIRLDLPVVLDFKDVDAELTLPFFKLAV